jgi:uncharacterized protein YndB with AHSA1/START domain
MTDAKSPLHDLELLVVEEVRIDASLEDSFAALLEQMGPHNERPDGTAMPMTLEAHPGGRWFRDLGQDDGHFWGHVQAIRRPSLLEITGPLFISGPVASNLQYRLTRSDGGTLLSLRHNAFGLIPADARRGLTKGWRPLLGRVKSRAEAA